jgi:hypothetical protein
LEVRRIAPGDALVAVADGGDPTAILYSGRKGWHFPYDNGMGGGTPADSKQAIAQLERLRAQGADYLVLTRYTRWYLDYYEEFRQHLDSLYSRVADTQDFVIFEITNRTHPKTHTKAERRPA